MPIRQPIVSVLGHVDHGKTTLLDKIRGTAVASREVGAITQHIGATEVPLETILKTCDKLTKGKEFNIPGLLFIDTPGHHSFNTLRARGSALADLAILIIDVREGFMPQTIESLKILKRFKTPLVVVANKIDLLMGWRKKPLAPFKESFKEQAESTRELLMNKIYEFSADLDKHGFSADIYDQIEDFTANVAIIPLSAKTGEGIPDLLLILIGLAQRFLEKDLFTDEDAPGEATVLEVKEVKGLGLTLDAILYKGMVRKGDRIVIGSFGEPVVTNVRAILKPRPLDEIKDPRDEFMATDEVSAAAGIKISASNLEGVISGAPLRVAAGNEDSLKAEVKADMTLDVEVKDEGLIIKADAIGSLEALIFELRNLDIPIRKCEIGSVSKKDVIEAATLRDPLKKCILAFNVSVLPDAKEELAKYKEEVGIFTNNVIYKLIEDHKTWIEEKKIELDKLRRREISYPGSVLFLPNCTFRVSKPAVVGVRVLVGRISAGKGLVRPDGKVIGRIKSIQRENKSVREAIAGNEVAIAIEGITVGRQINEGDLLYVDIPEAHVKLLKDVELNRDEKEILEKVLEIRRKSDVFWGM